MHASSLLLLLGGGFLPSPFTLAAQTYSYDVTARVPAPLPSSPAIITSLFDQEHVTDPNITVSGSCPANSYVKIFLGSSAVGVGSCTNNTFSVPFTIMPGANTVTAKVYNITDDEGPSSPSITVFYDAPSPPPQNPSSPPTQLFISTIDGKTFINGEFLLLSTQLPTFTGLAPPFSKITITIHSNVVRCLTVANKFGWWSCTITDPLDPGIHLVHVEALTPDGRTLIYPDFYVRVVTSNPQKSASASAPPILDIPYQFAIRAPGQQWQWTVSMHGGTAPFSLNINWGDGKTDHVVRSDSADFTITHTYDKAGIYQPLVTVTDKNGLSGDFQLLAEVRDPTLVTAQFGGTFWSHLDPWLAWPLYAAIVVGVGIFWSYELVALRHHIVKRRRQHA